MFILPFAALAAVAAFLGYAVVALVLFAFALFLLSFFRDPERVPEGGDETIVSPADGTVLSVAPAPEAPPGASRRLSIFMSVFNCHVNRAPVAGEIAGYEYSPGRMRAAFQEKASTENEQNRITLASPRGGVMFKQIAGALARRIIFYPKVGERLLRGQRIGMIRLGSRVDLFLPDDVDVLIGKGDKVRAGKTPIARWKA